MSTATPTRSPITVCTLWEGDYHKGVGALTNSLIEAGYHGTIWAGYRGPLPQWAVPCVQQGTDCIYRVTDSVQIVFVALQTDQHFAHFKPVWVKQVLSLHEPEAEGVVYFDPDIFLLSPWSFFEEWVQAGVAVCEDSGTPINPGHPRAVAWSRFATESGLTLYRPAEAYLNSGIVGLLRNSTDLLDHWILLMSELHRRYTVPAATHQATRSHNFHIPDQDTFTIATWTIPGPVSRIGPDGMGFSHGEWLTVHAIMIKKPWRRRVLYDWLTKGVEIERGTRMYWRFANGPARVEPTRRIRLHRFLLPLVAFLSRFYRRR